MSRALLNRRDTGHICRSTLALMALALCCCACSRLPLDTLLPVGWVKAEGVSVVPLLVATTRNRTAAGNAAMFDSERADQVNYASIAISVPPDASRTVGQVQWPTSSPGDPRLSFVTVSAEPIEKPGFVAALAAAAKKPKARGKVLLFIHGFNNRFDEAVYRFAQIVHDSGAPGAPVLFSWPSRGAVSLEAYREDAESAAQSRDALSQVLDAIAATPNVKEMTVLCHSMGCFLTFETMRARAISGRIGAKIKNVLFVAPDVDAESFRTQLHDMGSARPRFALFVSEDDAALRLSKSLHGGDPPRGHRSGSRALCRRISAGRRRDIRFDPPARKRSFPSIRRRDDGHEYDPDTAGRRAAGYGRRLEAPGSRAPMIRWSGLAMLASTEIELNQLEGALEQPRRDTIGFHRRGTS